MSDSITTSIDRITNAAQGLRDLFGPNSHTARDIEQEMAALEAEQAETGHSVEKGMAHLASVAEQLVSFAIDIRRHYREKRS